MGFMDESYQRVAITAEEKDQSLWKIYFLLILDKIGKTC